MSATVTKRAAHTDQEGSSNTPIPSPRNFPLGGRRAKVAPVPWSKTRNLLVGLLSNRVYSFLLAQAVSPMLRRVPWKRVLQGLIPKYIPHLFPSTFAARVITARCKWKGNSFKKDNPAFVSVPHPTSKPIAFRIAPVLKGRHLFRNDLSKGEFKPHC